MRDERETHTLREWARLCSSPGQGTTRVFTVHPRFTSSWALCSSPGEGTTRVFTVCTPSTSLHLWNERLSGRDGDGDAGGAPCVGGEPRGSVVRTGHRAGRDG